MRLEEVTAKALGLGFAACGAAPVAGLAEEGRRLDEWLARGGQAGMAYMARNREKRCDPALLVEGARSVIVTLTNYYAPPLSGSPDVPVVARYAYGRDYHGVVKGRLFQLFAFLQEREGRRLRGRVFVDSAPVFEREWARRAGLGWIGRNTLLIHPRWGSFCFIGVIVSDFEPEAYSEPYAANRCGTCRRCVDACPTGALRPFFVDANKCVSYNTIERKDPVPDAVRERMGGRFFGCDACQDACPWNRRAIPHRDEAFRPNEWLRRMTRRDWLRLDEAAFRERFADSPLLRPGLPHLQSILSDLPGKE